jgi:hypothetical protein
MPRAADITAPGYYWYYDASGARPVVVEVAPAEAPETQLEVRFIGREDWVLLQDMAGSFAGPIPPPLRE